MSQATRSAHRADGLENPAFQSALSRLSRASDAVWLLALTSGIVSTLFPAFFLPYPQFNVGRFFVYAGLLVRASLYVWAGDRLADRGGAVLRRLFLMGLVAGLFELLVDWWLVNGIVRGRLVYLSGPDVVLLSSPIWMPIAWACVIVELGYPLLRLFEWWQKKLSLRMAAALAALLCGVSAGMMVGFYEYFAYRAGWWMYQPARRMLGDFCTLYIPVGEAIMFPALLPIAANLLSEEKPTTAGAIAAGSQFAMMIAIGYGVAYVLLEGSFR